MNIAATKLAASVETGDLIMLFDDHGCTVARVFEIESMPDTGDLRFLLEHYRNDQFMGAVEVSPDATIVVAGGWV